MRFRTVILLTLFALAPLIAPAPAVVNSSATSATRPATTARKPETFPVTNASQFTSALSNAQPGDTILLSGAIAGGRFTTTRSGALGSPITIRGDGTARLSGSPYALEILHDYYRLENFILENSNKGLVIDNAEHGAVDHVHAMDIQQEAFKLRNQSRYWEFTYCSARRR